MIFSPFVKQTNKKNPAAKRNKERAFFFDPPHPRFFIAAESPSPLVLLRRALLAESRCRALRKKRATAKRRLPANPAAKKKEYLGSAGSFSVALPAAAAAARMLAQIQKEKNSRGESRASSAACVSHPTPILRAGTFLTPPTDQGHLQSPSLAVEAQEGEFSVSPQKVLARRLSSTTCIPRDCFLPLTSMTNLGNVDLGVAASRPGFPAGLKVRTLGTRGCTGLFFESSLSRSES